MSVHVRTCSCNCHVCLCLDYTLIVTDVHEIPKPVYAWCKTSAMLISVWVGGSDPTPPWAVGHML
jgi:hypothetical protein